MKIKNYNFTRKNIDGFLSDRFNGHFAQISTDTTLKLRSSVKDVARVELGEVPWDIEELTKKFVNPPQGVSDRDHVFGYDTPEGHVMGSIEYDNALREYIKNYPKMWDTVKRVLSLKRGTGRHASAYAISNRQIDEFIPTIEISGMKCTQYTAQSVEKSGAIKYDFLRVNALNDISEALKLVQISYGKIIPESIEINGIKVPGNRLLPFQGKLYDIWDLPNDLKVFEDVTKGRTETVFQFSTKGAKDWLFFFDGVRPDGSPLIKTVEDMAVFTALDRPGPLDAVVEVDGQEHNMLVEYTRRLRGMKPAPTPKIFTELLKQTQGILVYQESVQHLYQKITDCSLTEAEKFRSNVGKKKKAEIEKAYPVFMKAAVEKYGESEAQACWDAIQTFSAYGFCQAHAQAYATTAYVCAFLKHHFPLQWWCAVLTNADKDEVNEDFWMYCGHLIDLPDIKNSSDTYTVKGDRIVAPLNLLNGIGETAHHQLCKYMPYSSLEDFCNKIQKHREEGGTKQMVIKTKKDRKTKEEIQVLTEKVTYGRSALNKKIIYTLIISGCMDSFFDKDASTVEKLSLFETSFAQATNKKPETVPAQFSDIDDLNKFQLKKTILPAYSTPLLPLLIGKYNIRQTASGYTYDHTDGFDYQFISNNGIAAVDSKPFIKAAITRVVAGYILSTRSFNYQNGQKTACEITFDVDGKRYNMVRWADKSGKLPAGIDSKLDGTIALLIIRKYQVGKAFTVEQVRVLNPKIDFKRKESDSDE